MSDHYCCKRCGQEYHRCACPPAVIGDNLKAPSVTLRDSKRTEIATHEYNLLLSNMPGGWRVQLNGVLIFQATERARCVGVFDALRNALQL